MRFLTIRDEKDNTVRRARRLHFLAKTIYRALPRRLRPFAGPVAFRYDMLTRLRPEVWSVAGEERGSHLPLSICLYVTTSEYKSYLLKLIFGSSFRARYLGRAWLWNIFKAIPKEASGCSLVLAEVHESHLKLLGTRSGIVIPAWVSGEADLPLDPRVMRRKSVQSDVRKIREHALEFEITRDLHLFDDFYFNMYLPHVKARHGDGALLAPREDMKVQFENGDLLLIKKQDEPISGILITYEGGCPHLRYLGVRDGKRDNVRDGAIAAAYEFSLRYLEKKGYRRVHLGRSRAFLHDGVIRYKRKWSQRIVGGSTHKFVLQVLSDTSATRAFLQNTPFIFESFGELQGAVFVNSEAPLTPQALKQINRRYFHLGLSKLVVYCFRSSGAAKQNEFFTSRFRCKQPRYEEMSSAHWTDLSRGLGRTGIEITIYPDSEDCDL